MSDMQPNKDCRESCFLQLVTASVIASVSLFIYLRRSALPVSNGKDERKVEEICINETEHNTDSVSKSTQSVRSISSNSTCAWLGKPHPFTLEKEKYGDCVYLDYNATTPIYPEVTEAMLPFLATCFGNPSSSHVFAMPCKQAMELARSQVGELVNARNPVKEIVFTSCGTESDNRAIDIALHNYRKCKEKMKSSHMGDVDNTDATLGVNIPKPHIITSKIEHPAVICYLRVLKWEKHEIDLTVLPVNSEGFVDLEQLKAALTINTALVTIMHSNNEVGTIQRIREISGIVHQFNQDHQGESCVLVHSDGAQSLGKVLIDVQSLDLDMLTIVGHKFGAPKGIGALYIRQGVETLPMLVGGGQESGIRSGTENVALAVGLGAASKIALQENVPLLFHLLTLKLRLLNGLYDGFRDHMDKVKFNGPARANNPKELSSDLKILRVMAKSAASNDGGSSSFRVSSIADIVDQLPNTVSVSFKNTKSYKVLSLLDGKVACSAGSACHAVHLPVGGTNVTGGAPAIEEKISDVLMAMSVSEDFALGTLRISFGRHTTEEEIDRSVAHIVNCIMHSWKEISP